MAGFGGREALVPSRAQGAVDGEGADPPPPGDAAFVQRSTPRGGGERVLRWAAHGVVEGDFAAGGEVGQVDPHDLPPGRLQLAHHFDRVVLVVRDDQNHRSCPVPSCAMRLFWLAIATERPC